MLISLKSHQVHTIDHRKSVLYLTPFTADDFPVPTSENKINLHKGYFGYRTRTACEPYLNLWVAQLLFDAATVGI